MFKFGATFSVRIVQMQEQLQHLKSLQTMKICRLKHLIILSVILIL